MFVGGLYEWEIYLASGLNIHDAVTLLRVVFLVLVSFSMMDVYKRCQECWGKTRRLLSPERTP